MHDFKEVLSTPGCGIEEWSKVDWSPEEAAQDEGAGQAGEEDEAGQQLKHRGGLTSLSSTLELPSFTPNLVRKRGLRKLRRTVKAELPAATNPLTAPRCFLKYKPAKGWRVRSGQVK